MRDRCDLLVRASFLVTVFLPFLLLGPLLLLLAAQFAPSVPAQRHAASLGAGPQDAGPSEQQVLLCCACAVLRWTCVVVCCACACAVHQGMSTWQLDFTMQAGQTSSVVSAPMLLLCLHQCCCCAVLSLCWLSCCVSAMLCWALLCHAVLCF